MLLISQQDKRWGFKTIGNTSTLIKSKGCTISAISMISDYFGCYHDPSWMGKYLSFTAGALILWQSISKVLCFDFVWRGYNYNETAILDALKDPDKACLLEIRHAHWVVGIKKVPLLGYYVADPWLATRHFYPVSYISGFSVFKRK